MERLSADTVLLFSGLDPSGAAGIAADIETINQFGVTPLPIITTLTAQNTQKVLSLEPTNNLFLKVNFRGGRMPPFFIKNYLLCDIMFFEGITCLNMETMLALLVL